MSINSQKPAPPAPTGIKKWVFSLIPLLGLLVLAEGFFAEWFYQLHGDHPTALLGFGSQVRDLVQGGNGGSEFIRPAPPRGSQELVRFSSEPSPLYRPDPELGFGIAPGAYRITISRGDLELKFTAHVNERGHRVTSFADRKEAGQPRVGVFGDSFVWGWGNEDPVTAPWILQSLLPQVQVENYGGNAYGNLHALIQLKGLAEEKRLPDLVVLFYGFYYDERNAGSDHFLSLLSLPVFRSELDLARFTFPRARLDAAGKLQVERLPLLCISRGDCPPRNPSEEEMDRVTMEIFRQIRQTVGARPVLLAYVSGVSDQPVLDAAAALQFEVLDLRPRQVFDIDNFLPLDPHPGPRTQMAYARKLHQVLQPRLARLKTPSAS